MEEKETRCFWCLSETTGDKSKASSVLKYANKEHIFPESVGGIATLPIGDVCQECNSRLGTEVDRFLKTGDIGMMFAYQYTDGLTGKSRGKVDKERKTKEKEDISMYHGETHVKREGTVLKIENSTDGSQGDISYDNKFVRALHKCAANALCDRKGSEYVSRNHRELCNFIDGKNESDSAKWSYAVCRQNMFSTTFSFEPYEIQCAINNGIIIACILAFPSGLYVVGCLPDILEEGLLTSAISDLESNTPAISDWQKQGVDFFDHYNSTFCLDENKDFGDKLRFLWVQA